MRNIMETYPDIYNWICRLPSPYHEWNENPSRAIELRPWIGCNSALLVAERRERTNVMFFLKRIDKCFLNGQPVANVGELYTLGSCSLLDSEETAHEVKTFPLLLNFINCILHVLSHNDRPPLPEGTDLSSLESSESSINPSAITQSGADYRQLFNSAFTCASIFLCPRPFVGGGLIEQMEEKLISPQLLIAVGVEWEKTLIRYIEFIYTQWALLQVRIPSKSLSCSYIRSSSDIISINIDCPVMLMSKTNKKFEASLPTSDLEFNTLIYQQLESAIQLHRIVDIKEDCVELQMGIHGFKCDVFHYASLPFDPVRRDFHLLPNERYFPSQINVSIVPQNQSDMLLVSVPESSKTNRHIVSKKGLEGLPKPPRFPAFGLFRKAADAMNINNWMFEQSVRGSAATWKWTLFDNVNGTQVASNKPPKLSVSGSTKPWYRNRYSASTSPFTEEGGVHFSSDNYGQTLTWRHNRNMEGNILKWHVKGTIWLTYWPNEHNTSHSETRYHEFSEVVEFPLVLSDS